MSNNFVRANGQIQDLVKAALIGDCLCGHVRGGVCDGDLDARHHRSLLIGDRAHNLCGSLLGKRWMYSQKRQARNNGDCNGYTNSAAENGLHGDLNESWDKYCMLCSIETSVKSYEVSDA